MNARDQEKFKEKLENERKRLEDEIRGVADVNPENTGDWSANTSDIEVDSADENEVADKLEEFEENTAIAGQLESQLSEVKAALERVEKGTFGICEICGKPIENERLEANPSARISLKHSHIIDAK